jgi:hypothetical protein
MGLLSFIAKVLKAWNENREAVQESADQCERAIRWVSSRHRVSIKTLDRGTVQHALSQIEREFDGAYGGFGHDPEKPRLPKFPMAPLLKLLVYQAREAKDDRASEMLRVTLERMALGGIWDHVGGGFHRYSTDRFWKIPHFEKMLYDNAQLAQVYLEAFELTRNRDFAQVAQGVFKFVAAELVSPEFGFYSALDAESEHEEGRYYVWSDSEVRELLSEDEYRVFAPVYGLLAPPNFPPHAPDRYVLQRFQSLDRLAAISRTTPDELAGALTLMTKKLLVARNKRTKPLLDTKILTDWNALMIAALADGYRILHEPAYRKHAEAAAELLLTKCRDSAGRLLHVYTNGTAKIPAYLEDYAYLIHGLLALHRATGETLWLDEATRLADEMIATFWDEEWGGFYRDGPRHDQLLARLKPVQDSPYPSGNAAAVRGLLALARQTGEARYTECARRTLTAFSGFLDSTPGMHPEMVRGLAEFLDAGFSITVKSSEEPVEE